MKTILLVLVLASAAPASAQSPAERLAAEFTRKSSHSHSANGHTTQEYNEVVSDPWRATARDYAGHYRTSGDEGWTLDVDADLNGSGNDADGSYVLRDARLDDAVLIATKVYRGGKTERLEAVFLKRKKRIDPTDPYKSGLGIGYLQPVRVAQGHAHPTHVYLAKQRP
ncbi:MAG TPA: hypothetical protein VM100_13985 [Longimicrobiales bacterium]|nr:hypothetical protein [Longimicrobiales bacterium]